MKKNLNFRVPHSHLFTAPTTRDTPWYTFQGKVMRWVLSMQLHSYVDHWVGSFSSSTLIWNIQLSNGQNYMLSLNWTVCLLPLSIYMLTITCVLPKVHRTLFSDSSLSLPISGARKQRNAWHSSALPRRAEKRHRSWVSMCLSIWPKSSLCPSTDVFWATSMSKAHCSGQYKP